MKSEADLKKELLELKESNKKLETINKLKDDKNLKNSFFRNLLKKIKI